MLNRISISRHPIEFIIESMGEIIPGIDKVKGYYFDERDFAVKCISYLDGNIQHSTVSDKMIPAVQKQRGVSQKYEWFKDNSELFRDEPQGDFQISIEDSGKQNTLCIRFQNPIDHLNDMILIQFNGKLGALKLSLESDSIKPDEKSIIERLIFNHISFLLKNERNNKKLYQSVISNFESLKSSNNALKTEVSEKSDSYAKSIAYFCRSYVNKVAKAEKVTISITNDAIKKIITENVPFDKIEPILNRTMEVCLNRVLDFNDEIIIDEFDLMMPKERKGKTQPIQEEVAISDRYAKTKEYLDRYEKAAELLIQNGLNLTGQNIGAYCTPKITPAAISDNLKKHRSKIITLLHRYEEKWPIIRENYRPISKLLDNNNLDQKLKDAV